MRDVGKDSFVRSMEIRRDEVYSRILQEMSIMDNFISRKIKVVYHRIAIENIQVNKTAVFSKQIRYFFTSTEQVSTMSQTSVVTRSKYEPIQWDFCFIC